MGGNRGTRSSGWVRALVAVVLVTTVLGCGSPPSDPDRSGAGTSAPPDTTVQRSVVVADDGHELVVWHREPAGPTRGEVVLLHGLHWSARPDFDLDVAGQSVSLMENLAERGYATYAVDQRGYGDTERDASGWLTPDRAADDAAEVVDWVAEQAPAGRRPALLGWSMGGLTAMLVAQRDPAAISALVLYGIPPWGPAARPAETPEPLRRRNTAASAASAFTTPDETPAGVQDAYVALALSTDPVEVDWRGLDQLDELDPSLVRTPTLVIYGDRDALAVAADPTAVVERLGTDDRELVVLAGIDHAAHLEHPAPFADALVSFLADTD